ncbi:hypothetical protein GJ496_011823 [Pomphorhynchus laevis]|nr:hypothetical protein GJ496_011823 [Pomphorhynchus laevis]
MRCYCPWMNNDDTIIVIKFVLNSMYLALHPALSSLGFSNTIFATTAFMGKFLAANISSTYRMNVPGFSSVCTPDTDILYPKTFLSWQVLEFALSTISRSPKGPIKRQVIILKFAFSGKFLDLLSSHHQSLPGGPIPV